MARPDGFEPPTPWFEDRCSFSYYNYINHTVMALEL